MAAAASSKESSSIIPSAGEFLMFELLNDDDEEDICISIDCYPSTSTKHLINPLYINNNTDHIINSSRPSMASSSDDKEISVDPISLKHSVPIVKTAAAAAGGGGGGGDIVLRRSNSSMKKQQVTAITRKDSANFKYPVPPLPLPAAHTKSNMFLSCSLPSSASSSPQRGPPPFLKNNKKWRTQNQAPPPPLPPAISYFARQRSAAVSPFAVNNESTSTYNLARSKSCGEGRTSSPSDEFDIWSRKLNDRKNDHQQFHADHEDDDENVITTPANCEEFEEDDVEKTSRKKGNEARNSYDDSFKCGALCLYLPGFGKGKPVRPRKQEEEEEEQDEGEQKMMTSRHVVISRTVSLEKFECGSWSSSAIINDDRDAGDSTRYYDLPLELIRNSANDTDTPVATAFVFEREIKGVLKNSSSRRDDQPRDSHDSTSARHVRFSTSNPPSSCITPRLRKAREDFNAYLEAQGV